MAQDSEEFSLHAIRGREIGRANVEMQRRRRTEIVARRLVSLSTRHLHVLVSKKTVRGTVNMAPMEVTLQGATESRFWRQASLCMTTWYVCGLYGGRRRRDFAGLAVGARPSSVMSASYPAGHAHTKYSSCVHNLSPCHTSHRKHCRSRVLSDLFWLCRRGTGATGDPTCLTYSTQFRSTGIKEQGTLSAAVFMDVNNSSVPKAGLLYRALRSSAVLGSYLLSRLIFCLDTLALNSTSSSG